MAAPTPADFPWESRDKEAMSKTAYDRPLRRANRSLAEENFELKRLLRKNGIPWSDVARDHLQQTKSMKHKTRANTKAQQSVELRVPMEVLLKVVEFALTSSSTIIDPLSPSVPENLTDHEKSSGNQIAIHLLATCRTLYVEGKRILWERNEFTFTTPETVINFGELNVDLRANIKHVNFRIIAHYFDDERRKFRHKLSRSYHPELGSKQALQIAIRPKESPMNRGGFRSYTWSQVSDFLVALRAPYVPKYKSKAPRPRLFPSLKSLRLDLVNFTETILPLPGKDLHDVAGHELARTLNELQITGIPCDEPGMKATAELVGMVKHNGLYLESVPTYIASNKGLQFLSERNWCGRVVRPIPYCDLPAHVPGEDIPDLDASPIVAKEKGYPDSDKEDDEFMIWKRVPYSRDSPNREWTIFSSLSGYRIPDFDSEDEMEDDYDFGHVCPSCGEPHPGSSFLEDEDMDYFD